jgi:hypothetical protein
LFYDSAQVGGQLFDHFWVIGLKIGCFFGIVVQVVELNGWEILLDCGGLTRWTPAARAAGK